MENDANQHKIRVLLVDDDIYDQSLFALNLKKLHLGEQVALRTTWNAQEAIDFLEAGCLSSQPDLIVLDLKMPVADGFAFLDWRKSTPGSSRVPVVIFTGSENASEIQRALNLGAAAAFSKPVHYEHWKGVIQAICAFGQGVKQATVPPLSQRPMDLAPPGVQT